MAKQTEKNIESLKSEKQIMESPCKFFISKTNTWIKDLLISLHLKLSDQTLESCYMSLRRVTVRHRCQRSTQLQTVGFHRHRCLLNVLQNIHLEHRGIVNKWKSALAELLYTWTVAGFASEADTFLTLQKVAKKRKKKVTQFNQQAAAVLG